MLNKVVIFGVGLIGGSLGLSLINRSMANTVTGVGRNEENLRLALECGAVHNISTNPANAVIDADMVILATHVKAAQESLQHILPWLSSGTVVTDVGSAKVEIVQLASKIMPQNIFFVGGHPMAGSERQGVTGADPYLFENAFYILTPFPDTPGWVMDKVRYMAEGIGSRVIEMTPEEHDFAVAALSHLPHMAATALVNTLASIPGKERFLPLAAGGFRDTTRIAFSNPMMWRDIFLSNSELLFNVLNIFRQQLNILEKAIADRDEQGILDFLQAAREVRQQVPAKSKGYLPVLFEILITVPDHPGSIAEATGKLGNEGINISDIEILRVREGEGGSIRMAFASEKEQEAAVKILRQAGIQVVKR